MTDVTEIEITAIPAMQAVALSVDESACILAPGAAAQTGLLLLKASFQAVAGETENLEAIAAGIDGITAMLGTLLGTPE